MSDPVAVPRVLDLVLIVVMLAHDAVIEPAHPRHEPVGVMLTLVPGVCERSLRKKDEMGSSVNDLRVNENALADVLIGLKIKVTAHDARAWTFCALLFFKN